MEWIPADQDSSRSPLWPIIFYRPSLPLLKNLHPRHPAMTPAPVGLAGVAASEGAIISACKNASVITRQSRQQTLRSHRRSLRKIRQQRISAASLSDADVRVSQCAKLDMSAPRVPEVLHFFHRGYQMAYVVIEYITLTPSPVPDLPQKVTLALQWLRDIPAPTELVRIGPLGVGCDRYTLFKV